MARPTALNLQAPPFPPRPPRPPRGYCFRLNYFARPTPEAFLYQALVFEWLVNDRSGATTPSGSWGEGPPVVGDSHYPTTKENLVERGNRPRHRNQPHLLPYTAMYPRTKPQIPVHSAWPPIIYSSFLKQSLYNHSWVYGGNVRFVEPHVSKRYIWL